MASTPDLTCRELVELVTDYLTGAMLPVDRQRFEAHLAHCSGCRIHLEQMRQTIRLLGKLDEDSIPRETQEELLHVFRDWKRQY